MVHAVQVKGLFPSYLHVYIVDVEGTFEHSNET